MEEHRPKVAVGVLVVKGGKILIGERLSGHGSETFMIPGGHLEFGESFEEAAKRELAEETSLTDVEMKGVVSVGNDIVYDKHYVCIGVLVEWLSGEPYTAEPDKSKNWNWYDPNDLPENLFFHSKKMIENWLKGKIYTDA